LSFCTRFRVKLVDQIDDVEEPSPSAVPDAGARDADGEMGLSGSGAADQHEVALMIEEVADGQIPDQCLVDLSGLEVELLDLLGQR